jgi:NADPH:quinone reductase-like Zn-dependent oxidoreductase
MIPAKLNFPFILGRDLAGQVVEVGPQVQRFKPGDRVWASHQGFAGRQGTFSEFAAVDEGWLHPLPANVKEEDIVATSLVGLTAHLGLPRRGVEGGEICSSTAARRRRLGRRDGKDLRCARSTAGDDAEPPQPGAELAIN